MNLKGVISTTIIYGISDSIVVLLSGLLLLPLYTTTLSQQDFGSYIAIKTNIELLTYVIQFGLISAISRLYFDYRERGEADSYIMSIALWFPIQLTIAGIVLSLTGTSGWRMLAPSVSPNPYLCFAIAIIAATFYFNLTTTILRAEQRVVAFVVVQLIAALVLVVVALLLLARAKLGLPGLMWALFVSAAAGAVAFPAVLGRIDRPRLRLSHVKRSLAYALPIVMGLIAYFILNRINILILQRYVGISQLALYGLAQQLSLVIAVASAAFGKAVQPILFGAAELRLPELLRITMKIYVVGMSCVASLILIFASEIIRLVAPRNYADSHTILLLLIVAAFTYTLTLASDTAVLCRKLPTASATITLLGAALSAGLAFILIPRAGLVGAASALLLSSLVLAFAANEIARRLTGFTNLWPMIGGLIIVACSAIGAYCVNGMGLSHTPSVGVKIGLALLLVAGHLVVLRRYLLPTNEPVTPP